MEKKKRKYYNEITNINGPGNVMADGCNSITFYSPPDNTGTLRVNNLPVKSGCMFGLDGLEGEQDQTVYDVKIDNIGASDAYYVIRKFYKDDNNSTNN